MTTTPRRVAPRSWALAGTVAASALIAGQLAPLANVFATPAMAQEAGEAGEAGVALSAGPSAFLTELGLFEAAHRIAAQLSAEGETDLARAHLEASHHAFYEDLAEELEEHGAPQFEAQAEAFARAVNDGASAEEVTAAAEAVFAAIDAAGRSADAAALDELMSVKDLLLVAAADYEGGVEDGIVTFAQEYRDAWGFVATARARAETLAASQDATIAKAGRDALEQIDATAPLFPGLTAETAGGDPTLLPAAAAWIEIIALRLK